MAFWNEPTKEETKKFKLKTGTYAAQIFNVEIKETKLGDPGLSVQYRLNNNSRLWQNFTFRPTSSKWILWQMGVLDLNDKVRENTNNSEDMKILRDAYAQCLALLLSKYVELDISYEDYNGKEQQKIKLTKMATEEAFNKQEIKYEVEEKQAPGSLTLNESEELPF